MLDIKVIKQRKQTSINRKKKNMYRQYEKKLYQTCLISSGSVHQHEETHQSIMLTLIFDYH